MYIWCLCWLIASGDQTEQQQWKQGIMRLVIVGLNVLMLKGKGLWPTTSCLVTLLMAVLVKIGKKLTVTPPGMRPKELMHVEVQACCNLQKREWVLPSTGPGMSHGHRMAPSPPHSPAIAVGWFVSSCRGEKSASWAVLLSCLWQHPFGHLFLYAALGSSLLCVAAHSQLCWWLYCEQDFSVWGCQTRWN